jgi:hypothetical protein
MKNLFLGTFVFLSYQYIFPQHFFQPIVKVEGDCVNGFARIEYKDGEVYLGHCKDSLPDGYGTQYIMHSWLDKVTKTYTGNFKKGQRHGKGTIKYDDGEYYIGRWKNGLQHGIGQFMLPDSTTYKGGFKEGRMSGFGVYKNPHGHSYKGYFKWDKRNGFGIYKGKKGERYVGNFKDDNFNGMGKFTAPDGTTYNGHYKNNRFHGLGTLTKPDSLPQKGVWKNSKFLGTSHALLDSVKEPKPKDYVKQNYVYYDYLAVIVNIHTGYDYYDWNVNDYIIGSNIIETDAMNSVIVTDTFYYTIDGGCFRDSPAYWSDTPLDSFHDFVQTNSMVGLANNDNDFYWKTNVEVFRDGFHYNSGIMVHDKILSFLVRRSVDLLEPRALHIYNNNLPFESAR